MQRCKLPACPRRTTTHTGARSRLQVLGEANDIGCIDLRYRHARVPRRCQPPKLKISIPTRGATAFSEKSAHSHQPSVRRYRANGEMRSTTFDSTSLLGCRCRYRNMGLKFGRTRGSRRRRPSIAACISAVHGMMVNVDAMGGSVHRSDGMAISATPCGGNYDTCHRGRV
jgi:hypothetical protein